MHGLLSDNDLAETFDSAQARQRVHRFSQIPLPAQKTIVLTIARCQFCTRLREQHTFYSELLDAAIEGLRMVSPMTPRQV